MPSERLQDVLAAIASRTRRDIVLLLGESGPQSYTNLLQELHLQTGTLNYHLEKLVRLLEQDEFKRYRLNREGLVAYHSIKSTERLLASPSLPSLRKREIPKLGRDYGSALYKLVAKPTEAFKEANAKCLSYSLVALTVLIILYLALLLENPIAAASLSILLVSWTLFSSILQRIVYGSGASIAKTSLSVGLASLPYIPLVALNSLPIVGNGGVTFPSILPFQSSWQIGLGQLFSLLFIWRFALLFLGMRDLCRLSSTQSFIVVFISTLFESMVALGLATLQTSSLL